MILDHDIIIHYGPRDHFDPPKDVPIDRIRWDGKKWVDLKDLSTMWVEKKGNRFVLHCMQVPGSQQVVMTWADRKKLKEIAGVISIKSDSDLLDEERRKLRILAISRLKKSLEREVGEQEIRILELFALICALIVYARQQPQALKDFFDAVIPDILDSFPLARWETILKKALKDMDTLLHEYYTDLDNIP